MSTKSTLKEEYKSEIEERSEEELLEEEIRNQQTLDSFVETDKNWSPTSINKDANGAPTTSSSGRSSGILYYPLNIDQKAYDFLKVSAVEYVPNKFGSGGGITRDADERMGTKTLGTVFLPMQPGLAEASSVSWGDSTINALEAAAANIAGKTVGGAAEGGAAMLAGLMSGSKEAFVFSNSPNPKKNTTGNVY